MSEFVAGAERLSHCRKHQFRIIDTSERHPIDTVRVRIRQLCGELECETRLSASAWTRDRYEPVIVTKKRDEFVNLPLAPDQRARRDGQCRHGQRSQRWEAHVTELVKALGRNQILETVISEVTQLDIYEGRGRGRHEHLAAVARRRNSRGAMDVRSDVPLVGHDRFSGMNPDPDANRGVFQGTLGFSSGGNCFLRAGEDIEERVALCIHFNAVVRAKRGSQKTAVLGEHLGVPIAQFVEQPRRAFDVGEKESDRAGRQLGHQRFKSTATPHVRPVSPAWLRVWATGNVWLIPRRLK
ncbi:MAG TPA: hypothetical protein VE736_12815 [Gaiellaceae bacterium]|nr:hypothetical protein [Gaiellaceae bacterium]